MQSSACAVSSMCNAQRASACVAGIVLPPAAAHTEPDLVDVGPFGSDPKAGMPTGSHSAAASTPADSSAPGFTPGGNPKAGMPTEDDLSEVFGMAGLSGEEPLSGWGAGEAATAGSRQQALEKPLDEAFGIVSTSSGMVPSSAEHETHGARDGLHELVPGDADTVVAPKEAIQEVEDGRSRRVAAAGAPDGREHRTKHHRSKWTWSG